MKAHQIVNLHRNHNRIQFLVSLLCLIYPMFGYSQGEWNQWRFGALISVDFNTGSPVLLPNSPMNAGNHISGTVADSLGNLLFYSQGGQIWDKSNNIMNNGNGLYGIYYAKQSVFAVPNMPFDSTYYQMAYWERQIRIV